ncbi:radical SAM protein, partial [Desulfobacterales bacterium HSG16]|nr:radical SAM protein [Desulfobacterales bacterium HSG16]
MIIPVFIPHAGCRNMCIFCNQHAITNSSEPDLSFENIAQTITTYLSCPSKKKGRVEVAFYGGSFLGLSPEKIEELFKFMAGYIDSGQIHGIRFSTRPDDIDSKRLDIIKSRLVSTVEIGVQSMNDRVLTLSARGHTAQDVKNAASFLKECRVQTGMQMMVGLPGDDEATVMETALKIVEMSPDFIR